MRKICRCVELRLVDANLAVELVGKMINVLSFDPYKI
jgi:hypothetical protein